MSKEQELINFERLSRQEWQTLHQNQTPLLTEEELNDIKSLNDTINIQDVMDIYLPLLNLITIYKKSQENLTFSKSIFLKKAVPNRPFIIGVSGSVAVGKSTTSRLLQLLLARTFEHSKVEMVTTDGFLYPNATLIERQILDRKGFPESYDMEKLVNFLDRIKNGFPAQIPIYSHEIYDIVPDQTQIIAVPDFLIIEGINVFQNQQNNRLYMGDYFDFSIYIDAESENIETWYLERFKHILSISGGDKNNYYHQFTEIPLESALEFARSIWKKINLVNLENYIEPTRNRAEVIIHKDKNHKIDEIYLKK